jgi:hypothetical protein
MKVFENRVLRRIFGTKGQAQEKDKHNFLKRSFIIPALY